MMSNTSPVVIVGGGPIGLALACLMTLRGISVRVLEQRTTIPPHSRAIGIHPPASEVLQRIGIGKQVAQEAVAMREGVIYFESWRLGGLRLPEPVFTLPQSRTEALLEARLAELAPGTLLRGATVQEVSQTKDGVTVSYCTSNGKKESVCASIVVGCDGKNSRVRESAGIGWHGSSYPDTYVMGDFADDTILPNTAMLCLTRSGIVESFPLPQGQRRWVVHTPTWEESPTAARLSQLVAERLGTPLPVETCSWVSPFGIQGYIASQFAQGRIAIAGDAAHIVSPIGGQGMNLGFLDVAILATLWDGSPQALIAYDQQQRRRAVLVRQRAAFNTWVGRPLSPYSPLPLAITVALRLPPVAYQLRRTFTMRNL